MKFLFTRPPVLPENLIPAMNPVKLEFVLDRLYIKVSVTIFIAAVPPISTPLTEATEVTKEALDKL
jgi:hypothetical protein